LRIEIVREGVRRGGQLTFCDNGPGIADIKAAMTDGFTTTGRLGLFVGRSATGRSTTPAVKTYRWSRPAEGAGSDWLIADPPTPGSPQFGTPKMRTSAFLRNL
jgi:hypothetical protein